MSDMMHQDVDPQETKEWIDALESVLEEEGVERAHYLLENLLIKHVAAERIYRMTLLLPTSILSQ